MRTLNHEVPIIDCRASVEVAFSTSPHTKDDTGFSYSLKLMLDMTLR